MKSIEYGLIAKSALESLRELKIISFKDLRKRAGVYMPALEAAKVGEPVDRYLADFLVFVACEAIDERISEIDSEIESIKNDSPQMVTTKQMRDYLLENCMSLNYLLKSLKISKTFYLANVDSEKSNQLARFKNFFAMEILKKLYSLSFEKGYLESKKNHLKKEIV